MPNNKISLPDADIGTIRAALEANVRYATAKWSTTSYAGDRQVTESGTDYLPRPEQITFAFDEPRMPDREIWFTAQHAAADEEMQWLARLVWSSPDRREHVYDLEPETE